MEIYRKCGATPCGMGRQWLFLPVYVYIYYIRVCHTQHRLGYLNNQSLSLGSSTPLVISYNRISDMNVCREHHSQCHHSHHLYRKVIHCDRQKGGHFVEPVPSPMTCTCTLQCKHLPSAFLNLFLNTQNNPFMTGS